MAIAPKGYIEEDDPRVSQIGHPAPPWMVSYADLMSELVCFFVILYALTAALDKGTQEAVKQIETEIRAEGNIAVEVEYTREGVRIELQEGMADQEKGAEPGDQPGDQGEAVDEHEQEKSFLFASGQAALSPALQQILDTIAPKLKELNHRKEIVVEGHTDNVPIHTRRFRDNLDLSTQRAGNVVRYLVARHSFDPANVAAVGYGEHHPKVPNSDDRNRQINRRIVFFIKNAKPYVPPWLRQNAEGAEPGAEAPAKAVPAAAPGSEAEP